MNTKLKPSRKISAGALAGALSVLLVWALQQGGMNVSAEISSAFTTLLTFITGYFIAEPE